jgi:hypothetical protein
LYSDPKYYRVGLRVDPLSKRKFLAWCFYGALSSGWVFVIGFIPIGGNTGSFWLAGNFAYFGVVIVANIKVLTSTNNHSFFTFFFIFGSILLFFVVYLIESMIPQFPLFGSVVPMITSREFYLGMILLTFAIILIEIGLRYFNHALRLKLLDFS